jgi:hypothetical protein
LRTKRSDHRDWNRTEVTARPAEGKVRRGMEIDRANEDMTCDGDETCGR